MHEATRKLIAEQGRDAISIPAIAECAGVTPSTIYRRWGDLQELLADVAVERFRADEAPLDTGDARRDLETWVGHYAEEMSSVPGRQMIRDVLASRSEENPGKCCGFTREQIGEIEARARTAGVQFPDVETVMDHVIAPITYSILFKDPPEADQIGKLVEAAFRLTDRG